MKSILENLQLIAARKPVTIRYVLIPGYTDGPECLASLIRIMHSLPSSTDIEVLPYHTLGLVKWQKLGWEYPLAGVPEPTKEQVKVFREQLLQAGLRLGKTEES